MYILNRSWPKWSLVEHQLKLEQDLKYNSQISNLSNCKLYNNIVTLSLNNVSITIGENMRYFMYKYMIQEYDWYESINIIYKKIDSYMLSHFNAQVQCDAAVIRELCESRDSCSDLVFSRKEQKDFIEMLCIK